jgi:hypothetical protein
LDAKQEHAPLTTADRGIQNGGDLEFSGAGGLAIAVAVEDEEDDIFIPSAVE